jgi:hypothetical protein
VCVLQGEAQGLAGPQGHRGGRARAVGPELERGRQQQPVRDAPGGQTTRDQLEDRPDQPELRAGRVGDHHVHLAVRAPDPTQQDSRRPDPQDVAALQVPTAMASVSTAVAVADAKVVSSAIVRSA